MLRKILMAASLVVFANTAIAGTWAPTVGTAPIFAAELFGDGTVAIQPETATYTMSSTPSTGAAFNVEFTLTGATWAPALTSASLRLRGGTSGTASITLVEGGGVTASTAKYRLDVTNTFAGNPLLELFGFGVSGATGLNTPAGTVKMAISLTDQLGALDTAGAAGNIATSAEGTTITYVAQATPNKIDVSTGSTKFVTNAGVPNQLSAVLGTFEIDDIVGPLEANAADGTGTAWQVGQSTATTAASTGGGTITITGDFAAASALDADANPLTIEGVAISSCGTIAAPTTLTATAATWNLTQAQIAGAEAANACTVTMAIPATNATVIGPFTPGITMTVDYSNVDFRDESTTGALASIAKNGASASTDLILTPGGVFDGFVRVSNKSGVVGKVIVTMYNDAGSSVTFDLSGGSLAAQASTALISAADLYAQAQAADATFAHNDGKLRAIFEGEFSAIAAQSVTISTDNTTFTTF